MWDHPWSQPRDDSWSLSGASCKNWASQSSPAPGLKDEGTNSWEYKSWTSAQWSHYFGGSDLSSLSSQVHASGCLCGLHTCSIWLTADHNRPDSHSAWPWDCGQHTELLWSSVSSTVKWEKLQPPWDMAKAKSDVHTNCLGSCEDVSSDDKSGMRPEIMHFRWTTRWHAAAVWGPQSE